MHEQVLVTGASGFFGAHLMRTLGERALGPSRQELNLLDAGSVEEYLDQHRPGAILHAAAFVGGIGLHVKHPGRMALDNLKMGLHVLEAAAKFPGIHVVLISTACVYPADAPVPVAEASLYEGYPSPETAPYGLAKRELLSLAEALRAESQLDFSYLIPTNLYGPGDHFDEAKSHVVPALVRRVLEAKAQAVPSIEVWGDGKATRDLLFVEDAAEGVADVLRTGPYPLPMNIATGREVSIRELVETLVDLIEYTGEVRWDTSKPVGASRRVLDITRARQTFGFAPRTSLRQGLLKTIEWYRQSVASVT